MCQQCEKNPVYEFTNKRKLCRNCFVKWFHKKVLYINRKFGMINRGDIVGYFSSNHFRGVVLKEVLRFLSEKINVKLMKLSGTKENTLTQITKKAKINKIALGVTLDLESDFIIREIIGKDIKILNSGPMEKTKDKNIKLIKPLYLFLDKEILIYAKLKKLKFEKDKTTKNKISKFIDELEKKHPEIKRAIVKGYLGLYS